MKKLHRFITLLMFLTLSTNLISANYTVSGAGFTEVKGGCVENGTHYRATQIISCTESATRFEVVVAINQVYEDLIFDNS